MVQQWCLFGNDMEIVKRVRDLVKIRNYAQELFCEIE